MRYIGALVAGLLLAVLLAPLPARTASEALEWTPVDKPGRTGNLVVSPSEVSQIAAGYDNVLYAIDSENAKIYRSLDAGVSWEDITYNLVKAGAALPASKIAVAPDDSACVAVVTNSGTTVYWSADGGINWLATGSFGSSPTDTIQAIAISPEYIQGSRTYREIAIGTALWGNGTTDGQVWVYRIGDFPLSWQNQNLTVYPQLPSPTPPSNGEVSALAYAPRYPNDPMLLVVASTNSDISAAYQSKTWLCLSNRDTSTWNPTVTGYPVAIVPAGDGTGVSYVHSSLALPSNYSSSNASSRQLFVSFDGEPNTTYDDVYWLNNSTVTRLNVLGGANIDISSIAYYGTTNSGKLLAGDVNPIIDPVTLLPTKTVQVRRTQWTLSPPTWGWQLSSVPPTGPGNAQLSWGPSGTIAYCGTGQHPGVALDESAFSASLDGDKWRQMGLIDTVIKPADIAPAPDSKSLFITTYNSFGPQGIWRSAGEPLGYYWERVLTVDTTLVGGTTYNPVILRLSANYSIDYTMYAAEVYGNQIYVTHNRGNTWQKCLSAPGPIVDIKVIDIAVRDENTLYIALGGGYSGYISKSINGALTWLEPASTNLSEINMFALVDNQTILVGGKNGEVAYSSDGGESFTRIREVIGGGTGDVQVVADANFKNNHTIYAASNVPGDGIWRWTIGVSEWWERIDVSITDFEIGQPVAGLAVGPEGTLYALSMEAVTTTSGGVIRSLNPAEPDATKIEFDLVNDALPVGTTSPPTFDPTPIFPNNHLPYLKLSGDAKQNELWTIDSTNQIIYRFQDTLCKIGPTLLLPEAGQVIPIDSSGYVSSLLLQWNELTGATGYEAAIYLDSGATRSAWAGNTTISAIIATSGSNPARLITGTTYYWRVRAVETIRSPWSEIRSLEPALGAAQWSPIAVPGGISPPPGATEVPIRPAFAWKLADLATGYELMLARDSGFANVVVSLTGANALPTNVWECNRDLDYSTTYFWRVRAISATSQSEWGTGVFTTEPAPVGPVPAVQPKVTPSSDAIVVEAPTAAEYLPWIVVSLGAILFAALIILIVRTRR